MAAASIDEMGATRILIRGTDGVGKSAFNASARPLPFSAASRRLAPTVGPVTLAKEDAR